MDENVNSGIPIDPGDITQKVIQLEGTKGSGSKAINQKERYKERARGINATNTTEIVMKEKEEKSLTIKKIK